MNTDELTPAQRRQLARALEDSFPSYSALSRMLYYGLGERLETISAEGPLRNVIFVLIQWTETHGRLRDVIEAARAENPGNHNMREFIALLDNGEVELPEPYQQNVIGFGPRIRKVSGHKTMIRALAFTPDGRYLVSASLDRTLKVWDFAAAELHTLNGYIGEIMGVAITPDGRYAISASAGDGLWIWNLLSGDWLRSLDGSSVLDPKYVFTVAVTLDGRYCISKDWRGLQIWDLATGRWVRQHDEPDYSHVLTLSPDGKYLITDYRIGSEDGFLTFGLKIWNLGTLVVDGDYTLGSRTFGLHTSYIYDVDITPDGRIAVSASADTTLKMWHMLSGRELATFRGHTGQVMAVAVTPDGGCAISVSTDDTMKLWGLASRQLLATFQGDSNMMCCAVAPNRDIVVAGDSKGCLYFVPLIRE